ncbi:MAG TPA: hypothetical protein VGV40_06890 [Solirubrobacteraceae bacterium]|nr:hypothetical protein [Solirubrobacteraceae bacterium]
MSATAAQRVLAPFGRRRLEVTANEPLGAYRVLSAADPEGPVPAAGQFFMLSTDEGWGGGEGGRPFLPRAFSMLRREGDEVRFMLEDIGPGTSRLATLAPGDGLRVVGPLGAGFTPPPTHGALLVGGGVGLPPLCCLQDALLASHVETTTLVGFRSADHAAAATLLRDPRVATDDGSAGHRGPVTELLERELDETGAPQRTVYACGPPAMLEAVRRLCAARAVPAQLALESGMACGFGACFGCVVALRAGGYARVCVDGPVLDAHLLAEVPAHP